MWRFGKAFATASGGGKERTFTEEMFHDDAKEMEGMITAQFGVLIAGIGGWKGNGIA